MKFPFLKTNNIKILPMVGGPNGEEIKYICYAGDVENVLSNGCQYLNEEKDMPRQFPLIRRWMPDLRLKGIGEPPYVGADDLESELTKGQVLSSHGLKTCWMAGAIPQDTHEALLIGARPIKQESAEDLLREVVADHDSSIIRADLMPKIRAFLARSKA